MAVSYDQFLDAWNKSKWKDEWSQSDRDLAQLHPEFGMSMLSLKDDWHNATTPEQRAIANEGAEYQRKTWGNYSGGTDGSKYYSLGPLHEEADKKQQEITGYGPFDYSRAPDYQGVMDRVINYGPFSYDYKTDPSYQAYAKQYAREGRRASEDTMGQYAAMTGGRPSTAAMTAAQQAGNYYSAQMADKIPELYQQAYQRYLQEYQRQLQALDALNTDRNFEYGAYGDRYNQLLSQYDTVRGQENAEREQQNAEEATKYQRKISEDETNYAREQDRLNRERQTMLDQYNMEQDALDRERQDMLDSWSAQDQAWQDAQRRAQYGDYSGLRALGIDVDAWLASQQPTGGYGPGSEPPAPELPSTPQGQTINPGSPDYLSVLNNSIRDSYNPELTKSILASRGVPAEDILYSKQMQIEDTNKGGGTAGEAGEPTVSNRSGDNWVTVEGLPGRYSWQELLLMVEDGRVDEIFDKEKNTLTYRKAR